jgi:formylglycine-generating enzyme required for sulfatase activity
MSEGKFIIITIAATLLGCDGAARPSDAVGHAYYDEPQQRPIGVPYVADEPNPEEPMVVASPDECKRGRGIDADGNCVRLATRELEFGGMVQIPTGALLRGDIPARYDADRGRTRPHIAMAGQPMFPDTLPSFWMDGYEVSRKAYAKCVEQGGCTPAACIDGSDGRPTDRQLGDLDLAAFPQTCVTHKQAEAYCTWRGVRLPSEAEWEYAARGPQGWMYPWGNDFRDELGIALGPVGFDPLDVSYFGLKGFGGNAIEWVADSFEPEDNLMRYLAGPFRSDDGPLARSWAQWRRDACGGSDCDLGTRYVVKGGRVGARSGAFELPEGANVASLPKENFEGDHAVTRHERLGFRCAADLEPTQQSLGVPEGMPALPVFRDVGELELFRGVAEAVDRAEAERFCSMLVAPGDPKPEPGKLANNGWRLPTLMEIRELYQFFSGPGPFWTADGAAEQTFVDTQTAEWAAVEVQVDEALMARCIRKK